MLLKKKLLVLAIIFLLVFPAVSYAYSCEVARIKEVLRKILYISFTDPQSSSLTVNEVRDLLVFYLSISSQNATIDCSALGDSSNRPIFDVVNLAETLPDRIPACVDGTKYGECSKTRPAYCYAGAIHSKCGLCGCPANSVCGKSGKCETIGQNMTCSKDIDCGQGSFTGNYYCTSNYLYKNYVNYTCISPATPESRCVAVNGTYVLAYCNPAYNQICVNGESTCKTSLNDSAPTVAISVKPSSILKLQQFNVTVSGTDDTGLAAIWWWGVNTGDAELDKAHWFNCNGAKVCINSWLVSTNATGIMSLGANSRDTAYPIAGQPHQASEGAGIAYATVTITDPGTTAVSGLIIKGRLIDKFTLKPVANVAIFLGTSTTGQALNPVYTNANGEFAITTDTDITASKMFPYWPKCYQQGFFLLEKKFGGSLNVRLYLFDLVKEDKSFAVTGSEVNLGDIPLWPAVDIAVNSDIAVQMNIEYPEEGRSYGNSNYKTSHYLSNVVPLAYNARAQLKDQSGNTYYSPYKTYGLENGCAPVTLDFFGKQFSWSGVQTNVSNASNCFVKIDGVVVKSVYATDRNDCYSKTSFGGINCNTYAPYFTDGVHFLEQYFGANDRVNNEYCTCTNSVCVQGNQTAQNITLHSLTVNGSNLEAVYSKNFDTCAHLLTSTSTATHTQNYFCTQGSYIKTTAPLSGFNVVVGQNYKLCHGNNYNVCSLLMALGNYTTTKSSQNVCQSAQNNGLCSTLDPAYGNGYEAACCSEHGLCCCIDYDGGDNLYVASYAKKGTQAQYDKCGTAGQSYDIIEGVCTNGQLSGIPHYCPTGTKCQNVRYEPAVYANVSACVNETSFNQTAQSNITGICLVRDLYTSVPIFSAPDLGKGYAKAAKPGVNTISGLQSACSQQDFSNLLAQYCTQNSNLIQEQVMTYDSNGNWQGLSCGAYGCNYKNCTSISTTNQTTCTDSDNGYDFYKYGEVKDKSGTLYKDVCIPDLSGLSEFACKTDGYYTSTFYSCVNENKICSGGACVPASGNSWCNDPDGFNVNQYGVVSYSVEGTGYTSADYCVNDDGLVESKCNNKQKMTEYYSCKSIGKLCQNGACVNQTSSATASNSQLNVTRLFVGQYNNTKYDVVVSDTDGISKLLINKANGNYLMIGSPPCSTSVSSGTVTLYPSDFPLSGTVNDCKNSSITNQVSAQMPP